MASGEEGSTGVRLGRTIESSPAEEVEEEKRKWKRK